MRAVHLKRVGRIWHYQRRRPSEYADVEPRALIRFSLKTQDYAEARALAAEHSLALDRDWADAQARGKSLASDNQAVRHAAAAKVQKQHGFSPKPIDGLEDEELVERLRCLLTEATPASEQKALLGMVGTPKLTLTGAFERFWDHIQDEWMRLSHDQQRVKRNVYLKSIRNFEAAVGQIDFYAIERRHALTFRSWWLERLKSENLKPYTGNREINSLRRLVSFNYDIDSESRPNPFARVRLKEEAEVARVPLTSEQIRAIIAPDALTGLDERFQLLVRLLVNTGMRPVEAIGLTLDDIDLEDRIPHVHVRKNAVRGLKTDHSERLLPLLGVSLDAARELVERGGWASDSARTCMPPARSTRLCVRTV